MLTRERDLRWTLSPNMLLEVHPAVAAYVAVAACVVVSVAVHTGPMALFRAVSLAPQVACAEMAASIVSLSLILLAATVVGAGEADAS